MLHTFGVLVGVQERPCRQRGLLTRLLWGRGPWTSIEGPYPGILNNRNQHRGLSLHDGFWKLGVLFVGVLVIRALLFWVNIRAPDVWNHHRMDRTRIAPLSKWDVPWDLLMPLWRDKACSSYEPASFEKRANNSSGGSFHKLGALLYNKDHSILGPILGPLILGNS